MYSTMVGRLRLNRSRPRPRTVEAANFIHLYWDVAWFGIAFGSTLSFLPVYATRVGATGWQIALLSSPTLFRRAASSAYPVAVLPATVQLRGEPACEHTPRSLRPFFFR